MNIFFNKQMILCEISQMIIYEIAKMIINAITQMIICVITQMIINVITLMIINTISLKIICAMIQMIFHLYIEFDNLSKKKFVLFMLFQERMITQDRSVLLWQLFNFIIIIINIYLIILFFLKDMGYDDYGMIWHNFSWNQRWLMHFSYTYLNIFSIRVN